MRMLHNTFFCGFGHLTWTRLTELTVCAFVPADFESKCEQDMQAAEGAEWDLGADRASSKLHLINKLQIHTDAVG